MCQVRIKKKINNSQDVQNLVTAIILRQPGRFSRQYVEKATTYYLSGSKFCGKESQKEIKEIINHTLINFSSNGIIDYREGFYYGKVPLILKKF